MAKSCYKSKTSRLLTMLCMTASFFLVEIIVGYITNSIALVADSFHMLSDVVSLIVGFAAVRISKWKTSKNTYGWVRAEVLGALINSVFLIALCFSILVEALKRLVEVEEIENPQMLLIVGGAGLLVNIIGLCLFHDHGHSHGGGGGHGHSHSPKKHTVENEKLVEPNTTPTSEEGNKSLAESGNYGGSTYMSVISIEVDDTTSAPSGAQLNMRGVFLHVLGDALGSVIVVISALVIWFGKGDWKYYVDPAMSICMVCIILCTTIPLLKQASYILLQAVPDHLDLEDIQKKLQEIYGCGEIHEFHVWQLSGNKLIASLHVTSDNSQQFMEGSARMRSYLHKVGVHSSTIQPEFLQHTNSAIGNGRPCAVECGPNMSCHADTCCAERKRPEKLKSETHKHTSSAVKYSTSESQEEEADDNV